MSEFKKGDRVRVTYEGEVSWVAENGKGFEVTTGGEIGKYVYADPEHLTLIERPVEPLAPGSVVGHDDSTFVVTERAVTRVRLNGGVVEDSAHTARSLARNIAAGDDDFTLIHDGSKK